MRADVTTIEPAAKRATGYRPDIQGLRALAVGVVILDHVIGWPAGGFVGVDIFFVISGFLITGLLLKEHEKTGRISFTDFYRRRIRRIMPLALLVLAATYIASSWLYFGERVRAIGWDALWSALFAANWRFAVTGTDYMQADGPISPLRHYWSLSVEEQFYFLWPILIMLVLGAAARGFRWSVGRSRQVLGVILASLVAASVAFAFREVAHAPTVAYFSTISRAWELGAGALIAVAAPLLARAPAAARPMLQWAGLSGIAVSVFAVDEQTPFPVPGAILPVLSTTLVIAGGIGGQRLMLPLTNPVARYLGDISYSLYLWHFPVLILAGTVLPLTTRTSYALVLGAILLLSVASYHLLEDPIRKSSWLERAPQSPSRFSLVRHPAVQLGAVLVAVAAVVAVATPPTRPALSAASGGPVGSEEELSAQIRSALNATEWPPLTPALEELGNQGFAREDSQGCAPATPRGKDCTIRVAESGKLAVVVGDSTAVAWLPAIRAVLEPAGWKVHAMTYVGCPFIAATTVAGDASITRACPGHKEMVRSIIADAKPALVIVGNTYNQSMQDGRRPSLTAWEAGARTAQREWLSAAKKVVALQSPPPGMDPKKCITRLTSPSACVSSISEVWLSYGDADRRVWDSDGSYYIGTKEWVCASSNECPGVVGGVLVRRDPSHLTVEYARKIAPLLGQALAPILAD